MRMIATVSLLFLASVLGACGDSSNAFEFRTISADPSGEHVKIAYDMKAGDGVRMKMAMNGRMKMSGSMEMDVPMDISFVSTMQCTEVKANGDKILAMSFEQADFNLGGQLEGEKMPDFDVGGTVTIDKTGKVTVMDIETSSPEVNAKLSQMLKNPGFQYFVPMPPKGMRVGEALDMAEVMPQEELQQLMNSAAGGAMNIKPDLRGEIVLLGVREFGGERAAEFGVNMVMNIQMESDGMKMDMGMRVSGKQFSSLRTGLPIGTATSTMEMRMDSATGDMEFGSDSTMTLTITCEPLK